VAAVKLGRVKCHELIVALDWLDAVSGELEERAKIPTLDDLYPQKGG
jgi:hypothetical protein